MIKALTTAATGLEAQQANIDRISNDLANVNTDSYKRSRTEFQDLMYETTKEPGSALGAGSQTPVGVQTGMGVKVGSSHKLFEQGPAKMTGNPLDVFIEGEGFFPIELPNGEIAYTRHGVFHKSSAGILGLSGGGKLTPQIVVPENAQKINIGQDGQVSIATPDGNLTVIGQIQLVTFVNPEGLNARGAHLYKPSLASGQPIQGIPGENGRGSLLQGAVEGSNVNVANSMVDMIATQRAYEMGTKVMGAVNDMLGATANIK